MKKIVSLFLIVFICGCASRGVMREQTSTGVSLSKSNYTVIKAGARGESFGFSLFGIIPILSPNFADAKADLYRTVDQKLEGRSIALANQTQDESSLYLILFSFPKIIITADIVEFKDESLPNKVLAPTTVPFKEESLPNKVPVPIAVPEAAK
jgi:hypothetical protein